MIVLALPSLPRSITVNELIRRGYVMFRYFLRGFILVRVDRAEVYTISSRLWKIFGALIKVLYPLFKSLGIFERGYLLVYKVV